MGIVSMFFPQPKQSLPDYYIDKLKARWPGSFPMNCLNESVLPPYMKIYNMYNREQRYTEFEIDLNDYDLNNIAHIKALLSLFPEVSDDKDIDYCIIQLNKIGGALLADSVASASELESMSMTIPEEEKIIENKERVGEEKITKTKERVESCEDIEKHFPRAFAHPSGKGHSKLFNRCKGIFRRLMDFITDNLIAGDSKFDEENLYVPSYEPPKSQFNSPGPV